MDDLPTLQAAAVRALGDVLRATDSRPADRLRAAEALLRAAPSAVSAPGDVLALADRELLALARGEGVYPPQMGPMVPRAETVPSDAVQLPGLVTPDTDSRRGRTDTDSRRGVALNGSARNDEEAAKKGAPKRTRKSRHPAGGPKEDPPIRRPRGRPRKNGIEPWM